ncbi:MAG: hypothetical protein WBG89_01860 [Ornithinimicrobium sp.]
MALRWYTVVVGCHDAASRIHLGVRRGDVGQGGPSATWTVLTHPAGNEFCVLSAREQ